LALAVLPVTVWLLRRRPAHVGAGVDARRRAWRERAGVVLGAAACLATAAPESLNVSPWLVNRTAATADVRITWVLRQIDCSAAPEVLAATLVPGDLDDPRSYSLARGYTVAIDG